MNILFMAILSVINTASFVLAGWNAVIIAMGLCRKKIKTECTSCKINKFCIVVCARDEENVIAHLLTSLNELHYPRDKYDIWVVADNCTDATGDIAWSMGAYVMDRFDNTKCTKGYALNYFFNMIKLRNKDYDAYCVFDADNTVDAAFLSVMNDHINNGEKLICGRRYAKNAGENAVSGWYALYFSFITGIYMKARNNLGLSCLVGGTGFAFSADLVKEGWNTCTITEDAEFSIQNILKGNFATLAENAVFYDEQPVSLKGSIKQRKRWCAGTIQCLSHYFSSINYIRKKSSSKVLRASLVDSVMFMLAVPACAVTFLSVFILPFTGISIKIYILSLMILYISYVIFALLSAILSGENIKVLKKSIITFPIFAITWSISAAFACLNSHCAWEKTEHNSKYPYMLRYKQTKTTK